MTHHSVALIPDNITTIKKQSDECRPALFMKSELPKCPPLPSVTSSDHPEIGTNPPVKRIPRRFTVSTSSLIATNPRDVARSKSRFKVEKVGPSTQKAAKVKSDDCIPLHRSLSESSVVDTQGSEFLVTEGSALEVKNLTIEQLDKSENSVFHGVSEVSEILFQDDEENVKGMVSQDVQGKDEICNARNAVNSNEELVVQKHPDEENHRSNCMQFTAVFTLKCEPDTLPIQKHYDDATCVVKFTDNINLKFDIDKRSSCEQTINRNQPIEQLQQEVRKNVDNSPIMIKSEMALSCCSAMKDDSMDRDVIKEVVQDLVNYVAYEINDEDVVPYRKISFGNASGSSETLPTDSLSFLSRSSSSFTLNSSHDVETDEDVVRNVVRSLVRDILLQEKELLRRSLRKKRRNLVAISKMDRKLCS
ncbi:unnamed protein product [Onchocerca flexuosa]|nr:unnamed protein product [Onchocerca flexuosa]